MKDRTNLFLLGVIAILIVGALYLNHSYNQNYTFQDGTSSTQWPEENALVDITVYDAQGEAVQLSTFTEGPMILHYWGPHLEENDQTLPAIIEGWKAYGDQVPFLFICRPQSQEDDFTAAREYIASHGYEIPVYYDLDHQILTEMEMDEGCFTFFVTDQFTCNLYGQGPLTLDDFQTGIQDIKP